MTMRRMKGTQLVRASLGPLDSAKQPQTSMKPLQRHGVFQPQSIPSCVRLCTRSAGSGASDGSRMSVDSHASKFMEFDPRGCCALNRQA